MKTVSLGSLIAPVKPVRAGEDTYPVLSITMHEGLVFQQERFKKAIAGKDLSSYKVVNRGKLVVGFPIDEAVLDFQEITDAGIVSPAYGVWDVVDPKTVDSNYLGKYLRSPQAISYYKLRLRGTTARRRSLTRDAFEALPVPLPPISEQQRIAQILDAAASVIASSQKELIALSQVQANLLTSIAKTDYIPLGELVQIRSGTVKPSEQPYCALPHVAPDNIESGTGRMQNINTAAEDGVTSNKYAFSAGDLLYSKIRPYLNKFAIPQFDGVCSADMYALVPKEPATAEYLAMTLQSPRFLAYAEQQSGRASIPKINRKTLTAFPVTCHSETEIQQVTEIYQEAETARSAIQQKIEFLQELQNSLSTRAFAGQL